MTPQVAIDALSYGGGGVGRVEGKAVFVPGTAPGDVVRFRPLKEKKRFVQGQLVSIESPSALRRQPPCPVFGDCGGCQWQHLPYHHQVDWKERIFRDFLVRQNGVAEELILPFVAAPDEWNYRSRVQFKCRQTPAGFVIGFFRTASHYVIDVAQCPIAAPAINRALTLLREWFPGSPHPAQIPQVDLALDDEGQVAAVVHVIGDELESVRRYLAPRLEDAGIGFHLQSGRKDTLVHVAGPRELTIRPLEGEPMRLGYPVGGFAQVNLAQNRRLVGEVLKAAGEVAGGKVLDLFCGMGNFSLPLASRGALVTGVEDFAPAIACAIRNALGNQLNSRFLCRPAAAALASDLAGADFDLVLLDPPRTGAYEVVRHLLAGRPERLLYISCDPATLARDLKPLLHNGYRVERAIGLDLFPQTYHLESLVHLRRY